MNQAKWTIFLDRDGVLNRKAPPDQYIRNWTEFHWLPGALDALRRLHGAGLRLLLATNQQGIAKGVMSQADVDDIHRRLKEDVARAGGMIDGVYVCPHLAGTCDCRKPGTGLFKQAQKEFPDIRFDRSVVVGDSQTDVEAGNNIGARTLQIVPQGAVPSGGADAVAESLAAATTRILMFT